MRKTKQFTPDLLERYRRDGRGQGIYQQYVPWHRVGRSDPSSMGRSHLMVWRGRQRELLSDVEWVTSLFATFVLNLDDIREQFPLALEAEAHELGAYSVCQASLRYPGSLDIAQQLGFKHPRVNGNGRSAPWVMTTDMLMTIKDGSGVRHLLAVACKYGDDLQDKRVIEKLSIEHHYWLARGVTWLLVTPNLYLESVALTLRTSLPWGLGQPVTPDERLIAIDIATQLEGCPLMSTLESITKTLGDLDNAQKAFWQAVWSRELPLDLRRGWRPHLPTAFLSPASFLLLNPIASRRSAWN